MGRDSGVNSVGGGDRKIASIHLTLAALAAPGTATPDRSKGK